MEDDIVTGLIIGAAIDVHKALGPGLLESAYSSALAHELTLRKIPFEREKPISVFYKGSCLDIGFRLDFLVMNQIVVEIKSVQAIAPIHRAQVLNYLKLTGCKLGLLLNFNVVLLRDGIKRVSGAPEPEPDIRRGTR